MAANADSHSVNVERAASIQAAKDARAAGGDAAEGRSYKFRLEGHVSRALVVTDCDPTCKGGTDTSISRVKDHGSSGTRFRMTGSSDTMAGVTAGATLEYSEAPAVRHANLFFSGKFGSLKLGHTSEAADGTTYHEKSGVWGVGHGQDAGDSMAAMYVPGMGGGRNEGLHFSSAAFGPASFALSVSNDDRYSAKLSVGGDAGVGSYTGSVAYLNTGTYEEVAGGLGIQLASGVTWSAAGGNRSDGKEGSFVQTDIGYVFGANAVRLSWYGSSDVVPAPTATPVTDAHPHTTKTAHEMGDGTAFGIGFMHTMAKAGVKITASVQQYSADLVDGTEYDDVVAIVGARVSF